MSHIIAVEETGIAIFLSSDGETFKIPLRYLEATAGAFPAAGDAIVNEDPISLQETSDILELLFRFICPPTESDNHCQPDVSELDVPTFFKLAEAAEKYQVYGAMNTAMIYML